MADHSFLPSSLYSLPCGGTRVQSPTMPPDAQKKRCQATAAAGDNNMFEGNDPPIIFSTTENNDGVTNELVVLPPPPLEQHQQSYEVADHHRLMRDFSYVEPLLRCFLTCRAQGKNLTCNGQNGVFLARRVVPGYHPAAAVEEFTLFEDQQDGTVVLQNTVHKRFLCVPAKKG